MSKSGRSVLNVRDMNTMITSAPPGSSVLNVRDMSTMNANAFRRVDVLIICLVMMLIIRRLLRMSMFLLRIPMLLRMFMFLLKFLVSWRSH